MEKTIASEIEDETIAQTTNDNENRSSSTVEIINKTRRTRFERRNSVVAPLTVHPTFSEPSVMANRSPNSFVLEPRNPRQHVLITTTGVKRTQSTPLQSVSFKSSRETDDNGTDDGRVARAHRKKSGLLVKTTNKTFSNRDIEIAKSKDREPQTFVDRPKKNENINDDDVVSIHPPAASSSVASTENVNPKEEIDDDDDDDDDSLLTFDIKQKIPVDVQYENTIEQSIVILTHLKKNYDNNYDCICPRCIYRNRITYLQRAWIDYFVYDYVSSSQGIILDAQSPYAQKSNTHKRDDEEGDDHDEKIFGFDHYEPRPNTNHAIKSDIWKTCDHFEYCDVLSTVVVSSERMTAITRIYVRYVPQSEGKKITSLDKTIVESSTTIVNLTVSDDDMYVLDRMTKTYVKHLFDLSKINKGKKIQTYCQRLNINIEHNTNDIYDQLPNTSSLSSPPLFFFDSQHADAFPNDTTACGYRQKPSDSSQMTYLVEYYESHDMCHKNIIIANKKMIRFHPSFNDDRCEERRSQDRFETTLGQIASFDVMRPLDFEIKTELNSNAKIVKMVVDPLNYVVDTLTPMHYHAGNVPTTTKKTDVVVSTTRTDDQLLRSNYTTLSKSNKRRSFSASSESANDLKNSEFSEDIEKLKKKPSSSSESFSSSSKSPRNKKIDASHRSSLEGSPADHATATAKLYESILTMVSSPSSISNDQTENDDSNASTTTLRVKKHAIKNDDYYHGKLTRLFDDVAREYGTILYNAYANKTFKKTVAKNLKKIKKERDHQRRQTSDAPTSFSSNCSLVLETTTSDALFQSSTRYGISYVVKHEYPTFVKKIAKRMTTQTSDDAYDEKSTNRTNTSSRFDKNFKKYNRHYYYIHKNDEEQNDDDDDDDDDKNEDRSQHAVKRLTTSCRTRIVSSSSSSYATHPIVATTPSSPRFVKSNSANGMMMTTTGASKNGVHHFGGDNDESAKKKIAKQHLIRSDGGNNDRDDIGDQPLRRTQLVKKKGSFLKIPISSKSSLAFSKKRQQQKQRQNDKLSHENDNDNDRYDEYSKYVQDKYESCGTSFESSTVSSSSSCSSPASRRVMKRSTTVNDDNRTKRQTDRAASVDIVCKKKQNRYPNVPIFYTDANRALYRCFTYHYTSDRISCLNNANGGDISIESKMTHITSEETISKMQNSKKCLHLANRRDDPVGVEAARNATTSLRVTIPRLRSKYNDGYETQSAYFGVSTTYKSESHATPSDVVNRAMSDLKTDFVTQHILKDMVKSVTTLRLDQKKCKTKTKAIHRTLTALNANNASKIVVEIENLKDLKNAVVVDRALFVSVRNFFDVLKAYCIYDRLKKRSSFAEESEFGGAPSFCPFHENSDRTSRLTKTIDLHIVYRFIHKQRRCRPNATPNRNSEKYSSDDFGSKKIKPHENTKPPSSPPTPSSDDDTIMYDIPLNDDDENIAPSKTTYSNQQQIIMDVTVLSQNNNLSAEIITDMTIANKSITDSFDFWHWLCGGLPK
jgi:hypothetical protein